MLSLLGSAIGVVLAQVAISVALPLVPPSALPRLGGIVVDGRVLAFCLGLSLVATLLIGLLPALRRGGQEAHQQAHRVVHPVAAAPTRMPARCIRPPLAPGT